MKVSVFGAGYVGLVTAVCLAKIGHHVICIDNNAEKINKLNQGIPPLYEQGLETLLKTELAKGLLRFSLTAADALKDAELVMIAVGTPLSETGDIDLSFINQVITSVGKQLNSETLLVLKSTVPAGTAQALTQSLNSQLAERGLTIKVDVVSNPEFLQEGNAIEQFMQPDRIIIGADEPASIATLKKLYQPLLEEQVPLLVMDKASAELSKYASNALLATKISFINEISQIADKVGADIELVAAAVGQDYRINPRFLKAGCGFGGSCFPKDIMTLIAAARKLGVQPHLLESVMTRNALQQRCLFDAVNNFFKADLQGKTIALWGLTFKPNTDDVRYASSHIIAALFWEAGCCINAYDPLGSENFAKMHAAQSALRICRSALDALESADVLLVCTEWPEFAEADLALIKTKLTHAAIFDGRNLFDAEKLKKAGFYYYGIGINAVTVSQNTPGKEKKLSDA